MSHQTREKEITNNHKDRTHQTRVMSFNVWREYPTHTSWNRRLEAVLSLLHFHRPDIIGAQEFLLPMLRQFERHLPEFAWIGSGRDDGAEQGEFTPIFYRRDRFDLLDGATFWLASDPALPARGWGAACVRTVTWTRLRRRDSRQELFHFNTHFDHFSLRARRESAYLLLRQINRLAGNSPVVVTADLNCQENSAAYAILTGSGPKDALPVCVLRDTLKISECLPLGPRKTWRGFSPLRIGNARLDYIFVTHQIRVIQHAVLAGHCNGLYASDHLPVVADLELPDSLL